MKIGVYVCECGTNIVATVNVEKVLERIGKLSEVKIARYYKYACSSNGRN